jgi:DNA segregation ATPase FtsK/SpoIIIE, S-DNA-T family
MAKKKSRAPKSALVGRGIVRVWRFIATALGGLVRFIARGARDLDPVHQRDGLAFLFLLSSIIAAAGTWFHLNNIVGRALYSLIYGGFGRIGFFTPLLLLYFALRLFRVPDEKSATGRITVGTIALLLSSAGLTHMLNGSVGTGATAMRHGGGWLGYGVSHPLLLLLLFLKYLQGSLPPANGST